VNDENALGALMTAEYTRAEADYQSVRGRALTHIVGVGGIFVTFVSGFLAFAAAQHTGLLTPAARWCLYAGLVSFVLSTFAALILLIPRVTMVPDVTELEQSLGGDSDSTSLDSSVSLLRIRQIAWLRRANAYVSRWLVVAVILEVIGIALIATMAILVVQHTH
jgi:hypothetical protein